MKLSALRPYFLFLLIAIIAYWQFAFLAYSLRWDMLDCWLPWRYFAGTAFANGELPLWNPYQQLGYPAGVDLQGPVWYLESLLLSLTFGQSIYTLQWGLIFYFFLAGTGMYQLCRYLTKQETTAIIAGIAYMLSGFFVSHVQHFYSIISGAWMPFLLLFYIKMLDTKSYRDVIKASIILFFMITGGNQTFTIISFYLLLAIGAVHFFHERTAWKKLLLLNLGFVGATLLLSTFTIISTLQVMPHIDRLSGMNINMAAYGALTLPSLLSLLLPYATATDMDFVRTDVSMSNGYFGLLILVLVISWIWKRKGVINKVFFSFGLICLLVALGQDFFLYRFVFDFVPLMDLFRFPSYFSVLTTLCLVPIAAVQLQHVSENVASYKKRLSIIAGIFLLSLLLLFFYVATQIDLGSLSLFMQEEWPLRFTEASLFESIFVQALVQIFILLAFLFLLFKHRTKKQWLVSAGLLIFLEMFVATQLNIHSRGALDARPQEIKAFIDSLPQDFPIPQANDLLIDNTDAKASKWPLWRNTNVYHKKISHEGFNSFWLSDHYYLFDSLPQLAHAVLHNPLLYLSDELFHMEKLPDSLSPITMNKRLYVDAATYKKLEGRSFQHAPGDTLIVEHFSPNEIVVHVTCAESQFITLLQSNYPGWEVWVNEERVEHFASNHLFISAIVPGGESRVRFAYRNPALIKGLFVSYGTLTVFLLLLIYPAGKRFLNRKNNVAA